MKTIIIALLLGTGFNLYAQNDSEIWLHAKVYVTPAVNNAVIIDTIGSAIIKFRSPETFSYYGGFYMEDTLTKTTKEIKIPITYSVYLEEEGKFIQVEEDKLFFVVKSEFPAFDLLASPSSEDQVNEIFYQYEFTSYDLGSTWNIEIVK